MDNNSNTENNLQYQIEEELHKFNWGAFFLNFVWASFNGAWKEFWPSFVVMCILFLLSDIPLIGLLFGLLNILMAVYVGRHGNEWAWYGKKWESLDKFTSVQKVWAVASPFGFIILWSVIRIFILVISTYMFLPQVKVITAEAENISKTAVSKIVAAPNYQNFASGEDIVDFLSNLDPYIKYMPDNKSVIAAEKGPYQAVLTFEKNGDCSLEQKNCYILYSIKVNNKLKPPINKIYFDDKGGVQIEDLPG